MVANRKTMRLLLLLGLLGICHSLQIPRFSFSGGASPTSSGYSYETKTFQQQVHHTYNNNKSCSYNGTHLLCQVDHYDFQNNKTFMQRYLINSSWWEEGGPIFFYTGNEGDITWFCNNTVSAPNLPRGCAGQGVKHFRVLCGTLHPNSKPCWFSLNTATMATACPLVTKVLQYEVKPTCLLTLVYHMLGRECGLPQC